MILEAFRAFVKPQNSQSGLELEMFLINERNVGLQFSNIAWQSEKNIFKEICMYGIIGIIIISFGWGDLVLGQLYYTISSEGLFHFSQQKCRTPDAVFIGLWRFTNVY